MAKAVAVVGLLIAVAGCSSSDPFITSGSYKNWPLEPVSYAGATDVASHSGAQITVQTVSGENPTTDQLILPSAITNGSWDARHPNLSGTFNELDQKVFGESFRTELERLGLFSHVDSTKTALTNDDVRIKLHFAKTVYLRHAYRYVLYADMQIEKDGGPDSSWRYVADSNEGWSFAQWTFQMHQGEKAKARVAATLMKKMIADVEEWLKERGSIHSDTQPSAGLSAIGTERPLCPFQMTGLESAQRLHWVDSGNSGGTKGSEDLPCKAELGGRTVKNDNRCDLANYVDDFV
jgi:hypothetical protein